ncbi:MAG: class I tRNA ligase family protein, partial [Bdellovibrionales bacterium]|nr:class I tRNA ligase family protein [Bdellovibrionales bacterium]
FWKTENDNDKFEAFSTLYFVLSEFTKVAAPFIPFITDYIYGQLRLDHKLVQKDSVHLDQFPLVQDVSEEEKALEKEMDMIRGAIELGRELRERMKIRIRQPLSRIFIGTDSGRNVDESASLEILEELNVKKVEFLPKEQMARFTIKPNFKKLGRAWGAQMKELQQKLQRLTQVQIKNILEGQSFEMLGRKMTSDDFQIDLSPADTFKFETHSNGEVVVALDPEITDSLMQEGVAREVVHHVQRLRKEMDFNVEDRIILSIDVDQKTRQKLKGFSEMIENETLSRVQWVSLDKNDSIRAEIDDQVFCFNLACSGDS